uniref:hypothetical protein n=1 Tax=Thaumasiovibrio occultus TaxID=1891184 RepID=UPI000B356A06|nr:hypothetical protein [Thaumasiovibrio occultus]
MKIIETNLKNWLAGRMDDAAFQAFVCDHQRDIERRFSRSLYLKLKRCVRPVGRRVLETLWPCDSCSSITTLEDALALRENTCFKVVKRPNCTPVEFQYQGVTGPESFWQCRKCGSITLLVLPEREFKGWWGKVA